MHSDKKHRLFRALSRAGLDVTRTDSTWTVRLKNDPGSPPAEVLLPESLPLEEKALHQLAALASVRHPDGGRVDRAIATPDFHPGDGGIAIGSVVASRSLVIPAAVGDDINCGMRLHVADLPVDRFLTGKKDFVARMTGDYLQGSRDLPVATTSMRAAFRAGLPAFLEDARRAPMGALKGSDFAQLADETARVALGGACAGDERWAPEDLVPADRDSLRDDGLGTIGRGNHFVEVQLVDEVRDRALGHAWGVKKGQLAFMIHSGSRNVGRQIGKQWHDKVKAAWPAGVAHPASRIFPISVDRDPALAAEYLAAEATAANYGFLNRALLAELLRLRLREVFGASIAAPLVADLPHNITLKEAAGYVSRKGACPAHPGEPVIIPGSMGASSYLMVGLGSERFLNSASHGAGRAESRFSLSRGGDRRSDDDLGLSGVECVTLREERRREEAPAAYKPIDPVIDAQVAAGTVAVVAKLTPILTFKA